MAQNDGSLTALLDFLDKLDSSSIFYKLSNPTDRAIMVEISVPGERWEVEFFDDCDCRVEAFVTAGGVKGPEKLAELFERFSD